MADKYEEKKVYYIPAYVEKIRELGKCPVKVSFRTGEERCAVDFENSQGLLFTAEEVAENVDTITRSTLDEYSEKAQRKIEALTKQLEEANETIKAFSESENIVRTNFDAKVAENEELKVRNAELEALNNALVEENDKLGTERDQRNKDILAMKKDRDELDSIGGKLRAENENLKAWYEEANKTASEAAEANDELKAKIAELKAERDKFAKTAKDKADLANKACDERNDVQGDLETAKIAIDHLQEENKGLKQKLEDAEATYSVVADTSIERKNRVKTMEEVIVALVEKIRRLEGDD